MNYELGDKMNLKKEFIKLGYTEDDYNEIRNSYALMNIKDETLSIHLKDIFTFFLECGYTTEEVIKITKTLPAIYGLSIENMKQKIVDIMDLGYTKEEVIKMTKTLPTIYGLSIENIKQKIVDIMDLGYTKEEVIKMTKILPPIYSYSIENMKQKIVDIMELGYTKEEVIKITKTLPSIYGYSIENMKQKIADIMDLGYTKEEVIKMTKTLPTIYGLSIENIKQKIDFYNLIGMHELAVVDAKLLMQSINLSYARYSFYMNLGINVDMNNYRKLFINQKQFEKTYGITKEELLERYDYNKYKEEVEKKRG